MPSFSNMTDAEYISWTTNFIAVARIDSAKYGLTIAQIDNLEAKLTDLIEKVAARLAAADVAKAATAAQTASRNSVEPDCSYLTTIIKVNSDILDADKIALGIEPKKPATHTMPVAPTKVIVNGYEDGRNILKWDRAGNKQNTMFIIECREEVETEFKHLAATTETSYEQRNAAPGKQCAYRVRAQRSGEKSAYSNTAIVYMK